MTQIHSFNTGRGYTAQGQLIDYYHTAENTTVMGDLSRCVAYEFDGHLDDRGVLAAYDRGDGKLTLRADNFLHHGVVQEAAI